MHCKDKQNLDKKSQRELKLTRIRALAALDKLHSVSKTQQFAVILCVLSKIRKKNKLLIWGEEANTKSSPVTSSSSAPNTTALQILRTADS